MLQVLCFYGGVGGIRTRVPLITATRFPVVLVMTTSIPLHKLVIQIPALLLYYKLLNLTSLFCNIFKKFYQASAAMGAGCCCKRL